MSSAETMESVIGRKPDGMPGVLQGVKLCIQTLDDLPKATQDILRQKWSADFRSYTIVPQEGSSVAGMLWTISSEEREMIRDWEFVGTGWYEITDVKVNVEGDRTFAATTEVMGANQTYSSEVSGDSYPKFLNSEKDPQTKS